MISIAMYRCAIGNFNASYKIYMKKRNGSMNKFNFQSLYTMLSFILLMGKYFYGTYEKTLQNVNNKVCHVINGNVSANGTYNLLSWLAVIPYIGLTSLFQHFSSDARMLNLCF